MINKYDFPDKLFNDKLGVMSYLWDGMAIYCNKKFDMIYNLAGYSNKEGKEYYVKILKDGSIGIYSDKKTKHKIGIGTKIVK